jgi:DNA transformation protein
VSGAGDHDPEHIAELFSAFGPVAVRRMFGGAGLFAEGVMIAILDEGIIYLKADERTIPAFEREGLKPFTYSTKDGTRSLTSYWRMPERLYDAPDELARWATEALQAARRGTARKPQVARSRRAATKRVRRRKPKR